MIKILTADLSAVVRTIEKQIFSSCPDFEFISSCPDAALLLDDCRKLHPDFVLCSADIPDIRNVIKVISDELHIISVVMNTSLSASLLFYGATEIQKPEFVSMSKNDTNDFLNKLLQIYQFSNIKFDKIKRGINQESSKENCPCESKRKSKEKHFKALVVGVSTGGPKTLQLLIRSLGKDFPLPVFITQHVDTTFDKNMVSWLDKTVDLTVSLAEDGVVPLPGHVYFAPADNHLVFTKEKGDIKIVLDKSEPINFLRPAVDKMFSSAAEVYGENCLALLLTGMGNDGTEGCKAIKKYCGYTIGEAEESCVVYGMSKSAYEAGAIDEMLSLELMGKRVNQLVKIAGGGSNE